MQENNAICDRLTGGLPSLFLSRLLSITQALQDERDALSYYIPPVDPPILMWPLLFNEPLMPLFCTNLWVHLVVERSFDAHLFWLAS